MAEYRNSKFSTGEVSLDDNKFFDCTFDGCVLFYEGGQIPSLVACNLVNFKFEFRGPADNTVAFLKAMASPDSGLQSVIRDTFPALSAH